MIYRIKLTYIDYETKTRREVWMNRCYKTQARALKTASDMSYACRPDGKTLKSECIAQVVEQGGAQ